MLVQICLWSQMSPSSLMVYSCKDTSIALADSNRMLRLSCGTNTTADRGAARQMAQLHIMQRQGCNCRPRQNQERITGVTQLRHGGTQGMVRLEQLKSASAVFKHQGQTCIPCGLLARLAFACEVHLQGLTVLPSCGVRYGFQGSCRKPSFVHEASMIDGPVTEIFLSLTLLRCGSNSLAMMILYSWTPHMTPVGSEILQ